MEGAPGVASRPRRAGEAVALALEATLSRPRSDHRSEWARPPKMAVVYEESIRDEFTHQADSFARSPVMSAAETLGALVELVPPNGRPLAGGACGPGLIARALAGRVGSVHGVDLTPAMVEKAGGRGARRGGLENVSFSVGDATELEFEDGSFDGAVTRFSLHHIPAPKRVLAEMARVVRPGGWAIVGDHVTDAGRCRGRLAPGDRAAARSLALGLPGAEAAAGDRRRRLASASTASS